MAARAETDGRRGATRPREDMQLDRTSMLSFPVSVLTSLNSGRIKDSEHVRDIKESALCNRAEHAPCHVPMRTEGTRSDRHISGRGGTRCKNSSTLLKGSRHTPCREWEPTVDTHDQASLLTEFMAIALRLRERAKHRLRDQSSSKTHRGNGGAPW